MSQVDEVRAAADIVKIVGDYVKLNKAGANYVGLCPFHQEKTPSFAVHPAKQIFHCFGCGVGGDVFKFIMLSDNVTFPEALHRLAEKVGVTLSESYGDASFDANTRLRAALHKMHDAALKFFAAQLGATAEGRLARAYLADRGLTDEVVARFRLGYAPAAGQALVRHLTSAGFESDLLEKSGLVGHDVERNRYYDRFRRRVIFPIANESGKVVAFAGRALGDEQPKYLNSPETPIYTKGRLLYYLDRAGPAIRKLDYVILVEGYMDCIAVASAGSENVVASCGTSLTEAQIRLLARYSRRIVVNYDPDSAGVAATERSLALLLEEGFEAKVLALPGGLDPDSFLRKQGAAVYRQLLSAAPGYIDYLTDRAVAAHGTETPEGRAAVANAIAPYVAKVPNAMLRGELANKLATRLQVTDPLLREGLMRAAGVLKGEIRPPQGIYTSDANHAVKQLLRACLTDEQLAQEFVPQVIERGACEGLLGEEVFRKLAELLENGEKPEVARFEDSLSNAERKLVYDSLFWAGEAPDRQGALGYLRALRVRKVQRESEKLLTDIQSAARARDDARLADLRRAKIEVDKELRELSRRES